MTLTLDPACTDAAPPAVDSATPSALPSTRSRPAREELAIDPESSTDGGVGIIIRPRYGTTERHVRVRYRIHGPAGAPVVLLAGGTSAGRAARELPGDAAPGWWEAGIGPGRPLDTRRFRVLSFDWLTPTDLPGCLAIDTHDQAAAWSAALHHLGIHRLHAVVGYSYGGMVALALAASEPALVERLIVASAAHVSDPMATALRTIQRRIVKLGGDDPAAQAESLAVARGLAVTTYRSSAEFATRFAAAPRAEAGGFRHDVEDYLETVGNKFAAHYSAARFCALSESADLHAVDPALVHTPTTLIGIANDRLVPIADVRRLAYEIPATCRLYELDSMYGHDAFLKEAARIGEIVAVGLEQAAGAEVVGS